MKLVAGLMVLLYLSVLALLADALGWEFLFTLLLLAGTYWSILRFGRGDLPGVSLKGVALDIVYCSSRLLIKGGRESWLFGIHLHQRLHSKDHTKG